MKTKLIFAFGFIVGGIALFYTLPYYVREFGVINRSGIKQWADFEVPTFLDTSDLKELGEQLSFH